LKVAKIKSVSTGSTSPRKPKMKSGIFCIFFFCIK
jgi:hypothetical protein